MKPYAELTAPEREAAWAAVGDDNPFGSPPGYTQWYEAQHPDWRPAYRPTPKRRRRILSGGRGANDGR